MQKTIGNSLARAILFAAVLWGLGAPAQAQISPETSRKLEPIFAEAKGSFFGMIGRILQNHPMKDQLSEADLSRVLNGQKEIPYLFERLMVFAYQKDEPQFTQWAERGDAASLEKFRQAFIALAEEYAARFVGSLFRKTRQYDPRHLLRAGSGRPVEAGEHGQRRQQPEDRAKRPPAHARPARQCTQQCHAHDRQHEGQDEALEGWVMNE